MAKIEKVEIFTKEGVMEKTLMYLYPHLEKIADGMATGARNKALLSFRNDDTALSQIEAVFFEIAKQRFLRKTAYDLSLIVEQLPEDEKFALEYCFFTRRTSSRRIYPCARRCPYVHITEKNCRR